MSERPFVSVILPCLNEEASIRQAVRECRDGLELAGLRGEVIVSDNGSTDRSAARAAAAGARVIGSSPQGYGAAYLAAMKMARGDIIVMGDADLTYPMRRLGEFVELAETHDLVIGSRFGDNAGANIPFLNRYLGNPLLSGVSRLLFGGHVQDFHCGMRAVRRDALPVLDLHTPGMEFASEMIVKALRAGLSIGEVPIEYRERVGESKLNRWRDGWRHLRFLFCHAPDPVLLYPGLVLAVVGLVVNLAFLFGNVTILGRNWGLHTHAAALGCLVIGLQGFSLGVLARHFSALLLGEKRGAVGRLVRGFSLESGMLAGAVLLVIGVVMGLDVLVAWTQNGFGALDREHLLLTAVAFSTAGIQLVLISFFAGIVDLQHSRVDVQAHEHEHDREWATTASV